MFIVLIERACESEVKESPGTMYPSQLLLVFANIIVIIIIKQYRPYCTVRALDISALKEWDLSMTV